MNHGQAAFFFLNGLAQIKLIFPQGKNVKIVRIAEN